MQLMISDAGVEFVKKFCEDLKTHKPIDERERDSIKVFCELAPALRAPFDEHSDTTHVTASAIVVGAPGVVLHLHKRLNMWLQPGGHIDAGESVDQAALREAREETGLQLRHFMGELNNQPRFIHLDVHPGPSGHTHLDIRYLLVADNEIFAPAEGESKEVKWFAWDQVLDTAEDGARGAILAARQIVKV